MTEKYRAIDIANYILWYANTKHKNEKVTALKLHKILYYVAAKYMKTYNEPLFDEKIEKWLYGPVTPSVYQVFKGRGYNHLASPEPQIEITENGLKFISFEENSIGNEEHRKLFNDVIDELISKTANALVQKTHDESAWKDNKNLIEHGVRHLEYSNEELKEADI